METAGFVETIDEVLIRRCASQSVGWAQQVGMKLQQVGREWPGEKSQSETKLSENNYVVKTNNKEITHSITLSIILPKFNLNMKNTTFLNLFPPLSLLAEPITLRFGFPLSSLFRVMLAPWLAYKNTSSLHQSVIDKLWSWEGMNLFQVLKGGGKHWLFSVETEWWFVSLSGCGESLDRSEALTANRARAHPTPLPRLSHWGLIHQFSPARLTQLLLIMMTRLLLRVSPLCGYIVLYGSCSQSQRVQGLHHDMRYFWLVETSVPGKSSSKASCNSANNYYKHGGKKR